MAEHLPKTASVIAKYTDNRRHCLYYSMHNRIFRYDVLSNKSIDVNVSSDSYVFWVIFKSGWKFYLRSC